MEQNAESNLQTKWTADIAELREKGEKFNPDSSSLRLCTYEENLGLLLIDFEGGGTYIYYNFPAEAWDEMTKAVSAGRYFHAQIKNKYQFKKVIKDKLGKEEVYE